MLDNKKENAKKFVEYWTGKGKEKQESQKFWIDLLEHVFGVPNIDEYIFFEEPVMMENTGFIDGWIPSTKVLIEQKGSNVDLDSEIKLKNGKTRTPYEQAEQYNNARKYSEKARWIVICNFTEFRIYDMERPGGAPEVLYLKDLPKEYTRLNFLINFKDENIKREEELSKEAGNLIGKLYDALYAKYDDMKKVESQRSLNILCVRLVFCLYAEDAGLFNEKNQFIEYFKKVEPSNFRDTLINFFKVVDTPEEKRDKYMNPELLKFPYINGGLFSEENIEIPGFSNEIIKTLIEVANFNWSEISPTIFGAIFESTLNPETRRSGGMHYTSIENIHKVIDPLFLDDLKAELSQILEIKVASTKNKKIDAFIKKISSLTFLDPACGSGNFLTETYTCLRRLENECIRHKVKKGVIEGTQKIIVGDLPVKVNINQFYGIEINDFAVTVAKTALWIAESQMLKETEEIYKHNLEFLPLKTYNNIVEGNALRLDWDKCFGTDIGFDFIMGNPPFVGFTYMKKEQKEDIKELFGNVKNLDYVCCWYKKANDYILYKDNVKCCFVSTNSITQGETVARLWEFLNFKIIFAHKTFKWESESNSKAAVFCVIIGFQNANSTKNYIRKIYSNGKVINCKNINAYLLDLDDIIVKSINSPLCSCAPKMIYGNKPADGGNLIVEKKDYNEFCNDKIARKYLRKLLGGDELVKNKERYCLWLKDITPNELKQSRLILDRVQKCKSMRLNSIAKEIQKFASTPTLFAQITQPENEEFIALPEVSTSNRRYIPMNFFSSEVISTNLIKIIPKATIFHFSILISNVHMAWMRATCGRLGNGYRYSKDIVYNNFPWPIDISKGDKNLTNKEKELIKNGYPTIDKEGIEILEKTGKAILDARDLYKNSSLADLYDPDAMPPELVKAHKENDKAACKAYGFTKEQTANESACVSRLFELYKMLIE